MYLSISAIAAGFSVFIFTEIIHALGLGATLPVMLAAWAPAGITLLIGTSLLLHVGGRNERSFCPPESVQAS